MGSYDLDLEALALEVTQLKRKNEILEAENKQQYRLGSANPVAEITDAFANTSVYLLQLVIDKICEPRVYSLSVKADTEGAEVVAKMLEGVTGNAGM
ncbi:hypothetical protein TrLO_g13153 [Triparma laevis f. longispina]|uniref:Uncharacterized protein n=1 Tax=Triparma laevis f. longispina TaxID=1714387 RepID=A0A9W7CEQ8_9STRA|nr:hypothetical protein TrLO_g13153 [Triparma laevis f. longispina]